MKTGKRKGKVNTHYCKFQVCLFVVLRLIREFFTYIKTSPRETNFDLCLTLMAIEQRGLFSVSHLLHPFILVISEDPWHSHLLPSALQLRCHYLFSWHSQPGFSHAKRTRFNKASAAVQTSIHVPQTKNLPLWNSNVKLFVKLQVIYDKQQTFCLTMANCCLMIKLKCFVKSYGILECLIFLVLERKLIFLKGDRILQLHFLIV